MNFFETYFEGKANSDVVKNFNHANCFCLSFRAAGWHGFLNNLHSARLSSPFAWRTSLKKVSWHETKAASLAYVIIRRKRSRCDHRRREPHHETRVTSLGGGGETFELTFDKVQLLSPTRAWCWSTCSSLILGTPSLRAEAKRHQFTRYATRTSKKSHWGIIKSKSYLLFLSSLAWWMAQVNFLCGISIRGTIISRRDEISSLLMEKQKNRQLSIFPNSPNELLILLTSCVLWKASARTLAKS